MTESNDVSKLIREYSTQSSERIELQELAGRMEASLSAPVPCRPGFKEQLLQQLMTGARQVNRPWYRRPAIWGTSVAAAAAVAALAVGVRFIPMRSAPRMVVEQEPAVPTPKGNEGITSTGTAVVPKLTSALNLPTVALQDEVLEGGAAVAAAISEPDLSKGLKIFAVNGTAADRAQFEAIATAVGFTSKSQQGEGELSVTEGSRTLRMAADGRVTYADPVHYAPDKLVVRDAEKAREISRGFLDRARLPIPDANPQVKTDTGRGIYMVTFTPQVDGRPVVNARTTVTVTASSGVSQVEAYVQGSQTPQGAYLAVSSADAVAEASKGGDAQFSAADLVYVRTGSGWAVYLQPYWQVYGTKDGGARITRYVPALAR